MTTNDEIEERACAPTQPPGWLTSLVLLPGFIMGLGSWVIPSLCGRSFNMSRVSQTLVNDPVAYHILGLCKKHVLILYAKKET